MPYVPSRAAMADNIDDDDSTCSSRFIGAALRYSPQLLKPSVIQSSNAVRRLEYFVSYTLHLLRSVTTSSHCLVWFSPRAVCVFKMSVAKPARHTGRH